MKALLIAVLALGSVACGSSSGASTPSPTPSPSAQPTLMASEQAELAQLAARPLKLPPMDANGSCPRGHEPSITPYSDGTAASPPLYGAGPVYMQGGNRTTTSQNDYFDVAFFTDPTVHTVVLIRGKQLNGPAKVVFTGQYAAGPVVGTDTIGGARAQLHGELGLPADLLPSNPRAAPGWGIWSVRIGWDASVGRSNVQCIGLQVDVASATEVFAG